jgi:hypothetical protein
MPTTDQTSTNLGFALARLLTDESFRRRLKSVGHAGEHVVPVPQSTTVDDLIARVDDLAGPVLLAVADSSYPHGFRLAWLEGLKYVDTGR